MLVGHAAGAGEHQGFGADQRAQCQHASGHIGGAVVGAGAGQAHGKRIDSAGGVVGVTHEVIAAGIAIGHCHARDGHGLVAAGILVDKGKCAAAHRIQRVAVAGIGVERAGHHRCRASCREAAVINAGHIAGAQRQIGFGDGAVGVAGIAHGVIAATIAIVQRGAV